MSISAEYSPAIVGAIYLFFGLFQNFLREQKFERDMKRSECEGSVK